MAPSVNIACLQTRPMPDMDAALSEALPLAQSAIDQGADVLFLPEYCGGLRTDGARVVPPADQESDHGFLATFQDFAAQNSIWTNLGSVAITGADGKIFNRGYMLDDAGAIRGRYDKVHLFDVTLDEDHVYRESDTVCAGQEAVIHETPFGNIGHAICYDLRFPALFRDLAQSGADILCCPAAFTKQTGMAHWHVLNRARAIENTRFMVSACAVGAVPGGGECYGHSLIVDPWGHVLADGGDTEGVVMAKIDLSIIPKSQGAIPSLEHDRPFTSSRKAGKEAA